MDRNTDETLSKFLSLVLRHKPQLAKVTVNYYGGWVAVDQLLAGVRDTGRTMDLEILERIVREDQKKRYSFDASHQRIRANYGHSIPVDLGLEVQEPPAVLYHGTATRFLDAIQREGIRKRDRNWVHLSQDIPTAVKVGRRHGKPVVLVVDTARMAADGTSFYHSESGVWLTDYVDWRYVKELVHP